MRVSRISPALVAAHLFVLGAPSALAGNSLADASAASTLGALSIVAGSVILVATPVALSVQALTPNPNKPGAVQVRATDPKGQVHVLELPKATVEKAELKAGDKLATVPKENGAVLTKDGKPIVFVVAPERSALSHSHELAK